MLRLTLTNHAALVVAAALMLGFASAGPITQLANYHDFADARAWLGVEHAADVLSNAGFLLAGLCGLRHWQSGSAAYRVLCCALLATAIGSTWYHLAPDDGRLIWDRLPIALACAAVLACAFKRAMVPLLGAACASVAWWAWTGDLRPYLLLQLLPVVVVPILQWQHKAPARQRWLYAGAVALYLLAKVCELADTHILAFTGMVSGHTLKHVLASIAALLLVAVWRAPVGVEIVAEG